MNPASLYADGEVSPNLLEIILHFIVQDGPTGFYTGNRSITYAVLEMSDLK